MMNGCGKSDSRVVPAKLPNKAEEPVTEAAEGRGLAKGNSLGRNVLRTQSRAGTPSPLERVRQAAQRERKQRFTPLLHHVYDIGRLRAAYFALKRDAAAGIDGETWAHYGQALEENLQDLSGRLQRGRTERSRSGGRTSRRRTGGRGPSGFPRWRQLSPLQSSLGRLRALVRPE
jgi:hypothetical protein